MILACSSKRLCKRTCGDAEKCTSRRVWYWPRESLKIETSILMEGSLWQTKSLSSAWRTIFKYRFPMVSYQPQHSRPCPCRYTPRYGMSTIPTWKSLYLQGESHIIHMKKTHQFQHMFSNWDECEKKHDSRFLDNFPKKGHTRHSHELPSHFAKIRGNKLQEIFSMGCSGQDEFQNCKQILLPQELPYCNVYSVYSGLSNSKQNFLLRVITVPQEILLK